MREVLFRGKRIDDGEWIEGSLCTTIPSDENFYTISYFDFEGYYVEEKVIPETIGQYTGLTDKNGKKIFEGDIIKHFNHSDKPDEYAIYKVEFDEKICKFSGRLHKQWSAQLSKDLEKRYEVIGNIHDNPEL